MRSQVITAFDEFIPATAALTPVYTSAQFNSALGAGDQFSIHAIVDNVTGTTPTFNLLIEHSADGRNWIQRNDQTTSPTGVGEISIALGANTFAQRMYSDGTFGQSANSTPWSGDGAPLLPFVRFKLTMSANTSAHVKVHVALRGPR